MDDLISRQAAIDALSTPHGILYPIRTIEALPSAERHGRWISQEYMSEIDSFIYTEYKCSNCEERSKKKSNYCPNCGARMEVE